MTLTLTTPPTLEPVTLDEAKAQLRVTYDQEDALIGALVTAARQRIEAELGVALIATGFRETLDAWPLEIGTAVPVTDPLAALYAGPLKLRRGPLISVAAIAVADGTGTFQTVNPVSYAAEVGSRPGRIAPYDVAWPSPGVPVGGVRIDYTAGYGAGEAAVPAPLRQGHPAAGRRRVRASQRRPPVPGRAVDRAVPPGAPVSTPVSAAASYATPATLQAATATETAYGGATVAWADAAAIWIDFRPGAASYDQLEGVAPVRIETASATARDDPRAAAGQQLLAGDDHNPWRVLAVERRQPPVRRDDAAAG